MVQGAAVPVVSKLRLAVPVVYVFSGDPVSAGLADSLARPRGNMTGLTFMAADLNGKRLELLREISPELRRVAIIANPEHPEGASFTFLTSRARGLQQHAPSWGSCRLIRVPCPLEGLSAFGGGTQDCKIKQGRYPTTPLANRCEILSPRPTRLGSVHANRGW